MACQAFSADSFAPPTLDSPLPILMHHASGGDGLPVASHAHSMVSPGKEPHTPVQTPRIMLQLDVCLTCRPVVGGNVIIIIDE